MPMNSQESSWQFLELLVGSNFTALLVPQAGGTKPMWDEGWSEFFSSCICMHSFLLLDFQLCHLPYKHRACWFTLAALLLWQHYTTPMPLCGWAPGGHQLSWKIFLWWATFWFKIYPGFSSVQFSLVAQSCLTRWPHGLQHASLLHSWDFPGKSSGVGCHCLYPPIWFPIFNLYSLPPKLLPCASSVWIRSL